MGYYSKVININEIENGISEITTLHFNDGHCQCFGDCDCCFEKGKILSETKCYSHPQLQHKKKTYTSLEAIYQAMDAKKIHRTTAKTNGE